MDPLVTVIIPTYNWSSVLPYSIASVQRQTFTDWELLVVGDGCTDDSESVVRGVGDSRVRWINLPSNTGHQSQPNNEGLRQARGQFIAYLGHDDLWLPHHLSCLIQALDEGADLACGMTLLVGPNEGDRWPYPSSEKYQPGLWIPPTGFVHRRKVTDHVGGWPRYRDVAGHPEVELLQRAHTAGHRFSFVRRLTAIKLPAIARRDVYKTRPYHEQAAWSERIKNEDDLEMTELARIVFALSAATQPKPYRVMLSDFLDETRRGTVRRLRRMISRPASREHNSIDAAREFKGLEPKP